MLKVLTYIDVAAGHTGDREHSIDVIDDLLPLVQMVTHRSWKVTVALPLRVSQ